MSVRELSLLRPKLESLNKDLNCEELHHVGIDKLSNMTTERRRLIARDLMEFVNERVGWEKQLTGGVVILDHIPNSRTGKMDKGYLRALDLDQVEIYGDRSK